MFQPAVLGLFHPAKNVFAASWADRLARLPGGFNHRAWQSAESFNLRLFGEWRIT
jgi:hypothetical protein